MMRVEGVSPKTQRAFTDVTAETLSVEEVAVGAEPLHHIHTLCAEVADVTPTQSRRKVFTHHTLERGRRNCQKKEATVVIEDLQCKTHCWSSSVN